jgi:hypothetical protein
MDEWDAIMYPFLREIDIRSTDFAALARPYFGGVRGLREKMAIRRSLGREAWPPNRAP